MRKADPYNFAAAAAERVIREQGITSLPVDPVAIARSIGIDVQAKPASNAGVSGMLIRLNDQFCIAYATHIYSLGFRRFSIAHELGHYFLEGHVDAIFVDDSVHEFSRRLPIDDEVRARGRSLRGTVAYAEHIVLRGTSGRGRWPRGGREFGRYMLRLINGDGDPVHRMRPRTHCDRYQLGQQGRYAAMSRSLRDIDGIDWIRKNKPLPRDCVTRTLNIDPERVRRSDRAEGESALFGGDLRIKVSEDAIGLGGYGKTLTVLYGIEPPEEDDNDEKIIESWTPRHRR